MQTDRFLRIVLVVIALELLWIGLKDFAPPVTAQTAPMRVIISGVDGGFLPVALAGQTQNVGRDPLRPNGDEQASTACEHDRGSSWS